MESKKKLDAISTDISTISRKKKDNENKNSPLSVIIIDLWAVWFIRLELLNNSDVSIPIFIHEMNAIL